MGLKEPTVSRNYLITLTAVIHLRFTVTVIFDNFKVRLLIQLVTAVTAISSLILQKKGGDATHSH